MTCDVARNALLEVELPLSASSVELLQHLEECSACKRAADMLTHDLAALRVAAGRRTRKRGRIAAIVGTAALSAAAIVGVMVHLHAPPTVHSIAPVNSAARGIVSVH